MSSFDFGRDDNLRAALRVSEWPKFANRDGQVVSPFLASDFDGSTRFLNYSEAEHANKLPELYASKQECCGCTACEFKCPVAAIRMFPDEQGFLYPTVDAARCIGCGACLKVCPMK